MNIFTLPRPGVINLLLIALALLAIYGHAPAQRYHDAVNKRFTLETDLDKLAAAIPQKALEPPALDTPRAAYKPRQRVPARKPTLTTPRDQIGAYIAKESYKK